MPEDDRAAARRRLVELLQAYADESTRSAHAFAEAHGLHRTDVAALLAVVRAQREGRALTAGALGSVLGLSSGATTAVVDRLEHLGHVRRSRDGADRRRVTLHVDGTGSALGRAWFGPLARRLDDVLAAYDDETLALLTGFLDRVVSEVRAHRGGSEATPGGAAP